jgi:hypothetical protein
MVISTSAKVNAFLFLKIFANKITQSPFSIL